MYANLPPGYNVYKRKNINEELGSTHCPKCNCEMIVPDDLKVVISVGDGNVALNGAVRGI